MSKLKGAQVALLGVYLHARTVQGYASAVAACVKTLLSWKHCLHVLSLSCVAGSMQGHLTPSLYVRL